MNLRNQLYPGVGSIITWEIRQIRKLQAKHTFLNSSSLYPGSAPALLELPNSHTAGIRVAMIEHNGTPNELIEFEKNKKNT